MTEISVGILTSHVDDHAPAVIWALHQAGVEVFEWNWSDFPVRSTQTVQVFDIADAPTTSILDGRKVPSSLTSFWYRRRAPVTPHQRTHPADMDFVRRHSLQYLQGQLYALKAERWLNEPSAASRADSKAAQLVSARQCGFNVPPTVMTNDPQCLREFRASICGDIVMKSFLPQTWRDSQGTDYFTETTVIAKGELVDDDVVRLAPAIFQPLIQKRHELRVTIFGKYAQTLLLRSQEHYASIDWRMDQSLGRIPSELVPTPVDVEKKCRAVMAQLGIVYGAFDLIMDLQGLYHFVEVNQSGQFLFYDEADPAAGILQKFCACLTYDRLKPSDFPSLADYNSSGAAVAHDQTRFEASLMHQNPLFMDEAGF